MNRRFALRAEADRMSALQDNVVCHRRFKSGSHATDTWIPRNVADEFRVADHLKNMNNGQRVLVRTEERHAMIKTRMMAVPLSLLLTSTLPFSQARMRRQHTRLIETGKFHGDEIAARTGQRWLGLYIKGRSAVLRYSRIRVRTVYDDITDYGTKNKTGKQVSVASPREPVFLVNSATMLKPGPAISVFSEKVDFNKGLERFPVKLRLGNKSYTLKVVSPDKNPASCQSSSFPKNARLVLVSSKTAQTLYTLDDCGNDPSWYLLWAGDLDRDGKLDLYVNVTQHYDFSERKLFLSSRASKGKLVKEVAAFVTGGC